MNLLWICLTAVIISASIPESWAAEDYRTVLDSRGEAVAVPAEIDRVVSISDGLIEGVMISLGVEDKLVGVGSKTFQEVDNYTYPALNGEEFSYLNGMNTVSYLRPKIMMLPLVAEYDAGLNLESLASLDPDLVIVEMGSCTFWADDEMSKKALDALESLDIPVVVLYGTDFYQEPDISHLWEEILIIGQVFGKEAEANKLADYLEAQVNLVEDFTEDVPDNDKPSVLYFGLSPLAREEGAAGNTVSLTSFESWALENIVHAKNAFREESGYWHKINVEQVYGVDLETAEGLRSIQWMDWAAEK